MLVEYVSLAKLSRPGQLGAEANRALAIIANFAHIPAWRIHLPHYPWSLVMGGILRLFGDAIMPRSWSSNIALSVA